MRELAALDRQSGQVRQGLMQRDHWRNRKKRLSHPDIINEVEGLDTLGSRARQSAGYRSWRPFSLCLRSTKYIRWYMQPSDIYLE